MTANFVESKRQEFLNALIGVRPRDRFKVVIVDRRSLKLLNRILKLSEILEHDVARIEKIENNRKDDPAIEALYFLTPSKISVDSLISDFSSGGGGGSGSHQRGPGGPPSGRPRPPKYRAAHVFFTSELPDILLARIKKAGISSHIKALRELCIEYDSYDKHVFLTKMITRPIYRLYSPLVTRGFNDELEMISKKLANVCGALKENPVVRYLLLDQEDYGDTKARPLAFLFHTEMDRIRDNIPKESDSSRPPTELIIVDRSADPFAPILHEFTYEAMVYDLLDIEEGNKFTYTAQLGNGESEVKTVSLDDNDSVWQEFRFRHITDAQEGIMKRLNDLVGSNRTIANLRTGEKLNIHKMRDVIATMPQYKEQLSLLSAHVTIMEKCMEQFKVRALNDLAILEQNLVMGTTPDGDKYTSGDIDIAYMLNNPDIELRDKLRLLLIFFIANPSLTENERQKLAALAKFSYGAKETIRNMGLVLRWPHALDLLKQLQQRPSQQVKGGKWGLAAMRALDGGAANDGEGRPYDVSRYMPGFKNVLESSIMGQLSEELFPYVVPPERPNDARMSAGANSLRGSRATPAAARSSERSGSPANSMWSTLASSVGLQSSDNTRASTGSQPSSSTPLQIKSLRSGRLTWQKRESSPASTTTTSLTDSNTSAHPSPAIQSSRQRHAQGRVILFVIGGITHSEIRAADELSRKHGYEVIVGSTHVIEPEDYLYEVSTLSFEIMADDGRHRIEIKPSFFALGYGGPPEIDPLVLYNGDADIPTWRSKIRAIEPPSAAPHRPERAVGGDYRGSDSGYSASRGHERSRSRGQNRPPDGRSMTADYRSHGSAPPGIRGGDMHPGSSDRRQAPSGPRPYMGERSKSEAPSGSGSSRQAALSSRNEMSASPTVHRSESGQFGESQGFRAGYEEFKQQQREQQQIQEQQRQQQRQQREREQQQQMLRSQNRQPSAGNPGISAPIHDARSQRQPQLPSAEQQQMSKEELFRAKLEKSQQEWDALTGATKKKKNKFLLKR
ncbi:syntaxin binding protein 1 [Coemansia guatemalensis]|uniref:Syntaxin binding protein 1 n=1 Tax=Coemansia guatemalensis TaxID=2761395 RepID=A0A9W8LW14_9FUNG|nr:syntaxin binding protein 1 [Coemansia guatemalensis]